jgi:hypothetical protein
MKLNISLALFAVAGSAGSLNLNMRLDHWSRARKRWFWSLPVLQNPQLRQILIGRGRPCLAADRLTHAAASFIRWMSASLQAFGRRR